jgi:hypothetical protein
MRLLAKASGHFENHRMARQSRLAIHGVECMRYHVKGFNDFNVAPVILGSKMAAEGE